MVAAPGRRRDGGVHRHRAGADRIEFYLVPTGTNTWPQRRLLPNDAYAGHPYTARLDNRDEPLSAHLVVIATGPGGQTRYDAHNVYHP